MKKMRVFLKVIINLPRTVYLNFATLPFKQAIRLPMVVVSKFLLRGLYRGAIILPPHAKTGTIKIGVAFSADSGIIPNSHGMIVVRNGAKIHFNQGICIGQGSSICVNRGEIEFGKGFLCNVNCFFAASSAVRFNENVLVGWNVNFRDNDGHPLLNENGSILNEPKPITIGNHVWIASYADILKGVTIPDGTVVGYRSLVTKTVEESNCIVVGAPAKVVKRQVIWEREMPLHWTQPRNNPHQCI